MHSGLIVLQSRLLMRLMRADEPYASIAKLQFLVVHISGSNKQKVLQQAQAGTSITELPIRSILQQDISPVTVYWAA